MTRFNVPKMSHGDAEAKFQAKVFKELRAQGYKVIKLQANATTSIGTPDCIALKGKFWALLEFKKSKTAPKRPGQQEWIDWANRHSYGAFIYPENEKDVLADLARLNGGHDA